MLMNLLWAGVGLPNVGLGLVLLPLWYGVGLLSLTFLICSMIICLVLSGGVSQMLGGRKDFCGILGKMMADKLNMENVPLVLYQWKTALLH